MPGILTRRNSFDTLGPWKVMDDLENRLLDWATTPFGYTPIARMFSESNVAMPPLDVYETNDEVIVACSLPGIDAGKVELQVNNGQLTLSGEQKPFLTDVPEESVRVHFRNIQRHGKFSFTVSLPCEVEADKAEAKYQDGILRVRFSKAAHAKPVRIQIEGAPANQPALESKTK